MSITNHSQISKKTKMKKALFTLLLSLFTNIMFAQDSKMEMKKEDPKMMDGKMMDGKMDKDKMSEMKMKDGVMMMDSKMMMCSKNKCTVLKSNYECTDGSVVNTSGKVVKKDGTSMMLMNGQMMDKSGMVSTIPHGQKGHVCAEECHKKM